jgi:hypothetical protein
VLDDLDGSGHRLNFGKQLVLLPISFLQKVVDVDLFRKSGAVVVDVLDGFTLNCKAVSIVSLIDTRSATYLCPSRQT